MIRRIAARCTMRVYCIQNPCVSALDRNYLSQSETYDRVAPILHLDPDASISWLPCPDNSRREFLRRMNDRRRWGRIPERYLAFARVGVVCLANSRELDAPGIAFSQRNESIGASIIPQSSTALAYHGAEKWNISNYANASQRGESTIHFAL